MNRKYLELLLELLQLTEQLPLLLDPDAHSSKRLRTVLLKPLLPGPGARAGVEGAAPHLGGPRVSLDLTRGRCQGLSLDPSRLRSRLVPTVRGLILLLSLLFPMVTCRNYTAEVEYHKICYASFNNNIHVQYLLHTVSAWSGPVRCGRLTSCAPRQAALLARPPQ